MSLRWVSPHQEPVILASASPRRVQLLHQLGLIPDDIIPADSDETPYKAELPGPYARRMADQKAAIIAQQHPNAFIIGADTVVACGRRILPKAETAQDAKDCMTLLMGRSHRVYGGLSLYLPAHAVKDKAAGKIFTKLSLSHVAFRRLDEKELSHYISFGDWQGKAGGYAIQGDAAPFIRQIKGSYSQIMGLDIYQMAALLKSAGFAHVSS